MIELYHFAGAICAQKVRVCLAEKQLAWESRPVQDGPEGLRSAAYLALNPHGYVPTLVHGRRVLTESRLINEYLAALPQGPSVISADPLDRYHAAMWTKQVDDSLHLNIYVLSFAIVFRDGRLAMDADTLSRSLPLSNPVKRAYTLQMIEQGFDAPPVQTAITRFRVLLGEMETALAQQPWLAGSRYSLADVDLTPYLLRLDMLGIWPHLSAGHPNVARWYNAVRERASFQAALLDWFSEEDLAKARQKAEAAQRPLESLLAA